MSDDLYTYEYSGNGLYGKVLLERCWYCIGKGRSWKALSSKTGERALVDQYHNWGMSYRAGYPLREIPPDSVKSNSLRTRGRFRSATKEIIDEVGQIGNVYAAATVDISLFFANRR